MLDVQLCVEVFLRTETDLEVVGRSDENGDSAADVVDVQLVVNEFLGGKNFVPSNRLRPFTLQIDAAPTRCSAQNFLATIGGPVSCSCNILRAALR